MKKIITIIVAIALLTGVIKAKDDTNYFTIDESSIKIEVLKNNVDITKGGEISLNPVPSPQELPPQPPSQPEIPPPVGGYEDYYPYPYPYPYPYQYTDPPTDTIDTIDRIINLGQKIWEIIEKNQPVVNISVNYANALPYGIQHWTQLQGWSKPATKRYSFSAKNVYGIEVVKVTYQVHYIYGGNLNGKGKFLTGVTVEPINIETAWGYKVSLTAEVPDSTIANVGTHENPIAAMQVQLKWKIHTVLKDIEQKAIYYVQGDGLIQEIGSPFKSQINTQIIENIQKTKF